MGNKPSIKLFDSLELKAPDWQEITTYDGRKILKHFATREEVQEFRAVIYQPEQLDYEKKVFNLRLNSKTLVAAKYFKQTKTTELCADYYKGSIYLENMVLRMSQVDQVPYPDVVYLYKQLLFGFQELCAFYGPFNVNQDFVFINKKAEVKVWCHKQIQRNMPETIGSKYSISEEAMVFNIVKMIEKTQNKGSNIFSIGELLSKRSGMSFKTVIQKFQEIIRSKSIQIPSYVNSLKKLLDKVGGADPFEVIRIRESTKQSEHMTRSFQNGNQSKSPVPLQTNQGKQTTQGKVIVNLKEKKRQIINGSIPQSYAPIPSLSPGPLPQFQKIQNTNSKNIVYHSKFPFIRKPSLSNLQNPSSISRVKTLNSEVSHPKQSLLRSDSERSKILYTHSHSNSKQIKQNISAPSASPVKGHIRTHSRNHSNTSLGRNNSISQITQSPIEMTFVSTQIPPPIIQISSPLQHSPQPARQQSKGKRHIPFLTLEMESSVAPSIFTPKNNSILPTAASFEMNNTYNNVNSNRERFITSPSNTSYTIQEWSPTNSQRVKTKMVEVIQMKSQQSIIHTLPHIQPANSSLSQETLRYLNYPTRICQDSNHNKSPSECLTSNTKTKDPILEQSNPSHQLQYQPTNLLQLPLNLQISQELVNSIRSISFKRDKQLNSFSFDDIQNIWNQDTPLSKEQLIEFQNELNQQTRDIDCFKRKDFVIQYQEPVVVEPKSKNIGLFQDAGKDEGGLFQQKEQTHNFQSHPIRPVYVRPKSTKGKLFQVYNSDQIQPRILKFDTTIPQVSISQEQRSCATILLKDNQKDLFESRNKESQLKSYYQNLSANDSSHGSCYSLRSYRQQ